MWSAGTDIGAAATTHDGDPLYQDGAIIVDGGVSSCPADRKSNSS